MGWDNVKLDSCLCGGTPLMSVQNDYIRNQTIITAKCENCGRKKNSLVYGTDGVKVRDGMNMMCDYWNTEIKGKKLKFNTMLVSCRGNTGKLYSCCVSESLNHIGGQLEICMYDCELLSENGTIHRMKFVSPEEIEVVDCDTSSSKKNQAHWMSMFYSIACSHCGHTSGDRYNCERSKFCPSCGYSMDEDGFDCYGNPTKKDGDAIAH